MQQKPYSKLEKLYDQLLFTIDYHRIIGRSLERMKELEEEIRKDDQPPPTSI